MMRAGKDYLTKGAGAREGKRALCEPRGRMVKRGFENSSAGPKDEPAAKRRAARKPKR